jgi:molybdopterin synthase sulfur carrier subunit
VGPRRQVAVHVEVKLFATLRRYAPQLGVGESLNLAVKPGTTMAAIRDQLGLPQNEVRVVMRNHVQADLADEVLEGDRIAFVPAIAGG